MIGVISGQFSVSENSKIRFSQGALYWDGSSFNLEANQYDLRTWSGKKSVINGVKSNTGTPNDNVGLFYWSSSKSSTYAEDALPPSSSTPFAFANGGAISDFDVLSKDEWYYLLNSRTDASSKWGLATITTSNDASVQGFVLLPDNWTLPSGCSFTAGLETNLYNETQWQAMENASAVFLPLTGIRQGSDLTGDEYSIWWTSSKSTDYDNWSVMFYINSSPSVTYRSRNHGVGVRLVKR